MCKIFIDLMDDMFGKEFNGGYVQNMYKQGLMKNYGFMESRYGGVFRNHLDRTLCVFPAPTGIMESLVRWEY